MVADPRTQRLHAATEPPWNELREQRVLGQVLASRRRRAAQARQRAIGGAVLGVAAAAAVVFGVYTRGRAGVNTPASGAVAAHAQGPGATARLALLDGSEAVLLGDARVRVDEQRAERVRLTQTSGEVRYQVRHAPARPFVVRAAGVEVRVRGTEFTVALREGAVDVRVTRGRVEVDDGARMTVLVGGEQLRVLARDEAPAAAPPAAAATPEPVVPATTDPSANAEEPAVAARPAASASRHGGAGASGGGVPSVDELFERYGAARRAGNHAGAADAMRALIASHPRDPQVVSAYFQLGRVEVALGQYAAAADAYARCYRAAPRGSLAEDALAEEAASWQRAGDLARARATAARYLARHPAGEHAARMRAITAE